MRDGAPGRLAAGTLALALAAGTVLAAGSTRGEASAARSNAFQRLVLGLGAGSASSLADCPAAFDPSITGSCARGLEPVPGGFSFCLHHAGATLRR